MELPQIYLQHFERARSILELLIKRGIILEGRIIWLQFWLNSRLAAKTAI